MSVATRSDDLFAQTQRVMRQMDEQSVGKMPEEIRASLITAVSETYRLEGREPDMMEINAAVDKVLAEDGIKASPKRKIPLHYWVLGVIVAIPFIFPVLRLFEALIRVLLRMFV